jgi:tetratricopeptide (TPR) repeat protein
MRAWWIVTLCGLALCVTGCDMLTSKEARLRRAEQAEAAGNFAASAADLNKLVQAEPANPDFRLRMAHIDWVMGDLRSAEFELQQALAHGASPVATAEMRTDIALALGKGAELLAWLNAKDNEVLDPTRSVLRGRALLALGRYGDAQAQFETVLARDATSAPAMLGIAQALAGGGQLDAALGRLKPLVSTQAPATDARLLQARLFLARGQYADAERALTAARSLAGVAATLPQQVSFVLGMADSQLAQGKLDAAAKSSAELSRLASGSLPARLTAARVALARGQYVDGVAELQRVVSAVPDLVQARMLLGAAHFAQGNYMQASAQLEQVVQQAPDNIEARKLLARVELQMDRPDAALRTLSPALENAAGDSQLYTLAGEANVRSGDTDRALDVLERNVKAHPESVEAKLDLATAYLQARRYDAVVPLVRDLAPQEGSVRREALLLTALTATQGTLVARRELDNLLKQQPDRVDLRYLAAAYFGTQREFDRAKSEIQTVLAKRPNDTRALVILAKTEFANGRRQPAEEALQAALKTDPKSGAVRLMLAQLYLAGADIARARSSLDAAIAAAPGKADVVHSSGLILLDAGLLDEALARFRRATDLEPTNAVYWLSAARAQSALNQPAAARESVNKALTLKPGWVAAESMLVMLDLRSGGPDAALARASALRESRPGDPSAIILLGDIHMYAHHYDEAAKVYADAGRLTQDSTLAIKQFEAVRLANRDRPEESLERWLGLRPDDTRARLVLAQYFSNTGRPDRAISEFEFLIRQLPNEAPFLNNLAWLYYEKHDPRAESLARKAHELAPSNAAIADTYGWILLTARKVDAALPLLKIAVDGAKDDPTVHYHYGAALAAAGRPDEARTALALALKSSNRFDDREAAQKLLGQLGKQG